MNDIEILDASTRLIAREGFVFTDVFEYSNYLMDTLRVSLPSKEIKPGFEYLPTLLALERSAGSFATGDAVGAFTRASSERSQSDLDVEASKIERLVRLVAQNTPVKTLKDRCLDISWLVTGMLQHLGVWAITYRGTLEYVSKSGQIIKRLDYIDDVINPPKGENAAKGHSWVFTTAIPVIDLTAKYQSVNPLATANVPNVVLSRSENSPSISRSLYIDVARSAKYKFTADQFLSRKGTWPEWNRMHKPVEIRGEVILRYVPMDIALSDPQINESPKYGDDIEIGGLSAWDFFEQHRSELE